MLGAMDRRSPTSAVGRGGLRGRLGGFREERGSILVLCAVMIPLFLLLGALVIDVGAWYTHKRQLQNRADAAAFAAGVEYAKNWKACVQGGDSALRASTAVKIADVAREFAGDPEASDYAGATLPPSLRNTEVANQARLDVVINSNDPNYTDDTDYTDGGGSPGFGTPCALHAIGDDISAPGHWTDVRVKERDLPSLFGGIGLPLARNMARARIEVRPALSGTRFLPLAVPNNIMTKVQVRYYNHCTSPATLLETRDLAPLPDQYQGGVAALGGGTLWALPNGAGVGDPNERFQLTLPTYGGCGQPYLPVGVEVRIASRNEIDLNAYSCAQLLAMQYADCFTRLSQLRIWNDGNAENQVRIRDVRLIGGCGNSDDAYFGTLPVAQTQCRFGASVDVFWGTRAKDELAVSSNFTVKVNGVAATAPSPTSPNGLWTVADDALTATAGANTVTVEVDWTDTNTSHTWEEGGGQCRTGSHNPCKYDGPVEPVHRAFVGTPATAGAVALVRTSNSPWNTTENLPGDPYDNKADGGNTISVYPTVGIRTVLKTGVYTTLRLDDPQSNQTLQCDPNYAQGQEFSTFRYGCGPWYGANSFTSTPNPNTTKSWWNTTTKTCPPDGEWFSASNLGFGFGTNSAGNPWRCVLTAPGMSTGQVGDYMAAATDNCDAYNNNSCQVFDCNYDGNYDGKLGPTQKWSGDSTYPRVINLFIVPYQASKGLTGQGDELPVLGFASFYVMNWTGSNTNQSDPCPDRTFDHDKNPVTDDINLPNPPSGAISGVFVETVDYETGPVDSTAVCEEGQLTPCRIALVR